MFCAWSKISNQTFSSGKFTCKYWSISSSQVVLVVKNPPVNSGDIRDVGLIPGLGRFPGGDSGNPLQYSAWRVPWTEEPGGLQSTGSQTVRQDWLELEYTHTHTHTHTHIGLPSRSVGKESACNGGDPSSIPRSGTCTWEGIGYPLQYSWASLMAQQVKNLPAMWETWVQSLGWEAPLEKGMAAHSSILAWRIPWTL